MVAPTGKATLHSVAAALIHNAASEAQRGGQGTIGSIIADAAGQVKGFNDVISVNSKLVLKQLDAQKKLDKEYDRYVALMRLKEKAEYKDKAHAEKMTKIMEKQKEKMARLRGEMKEVNEELDESNKQMNQLNKHNSIAATGFKFLAAKLVGAAVGVGGFSLALHNLEKRAKLSAVQLQYLGDTSGGYYETLNNVRKGMGAWDNAIDSATMKNAKLGISVDETHEMFQSLGQDLRLTTNDYRNMAQIVGQASEDIGFLSKVLQTDTNSLVRATTEASAKFNKGTQQTMDDMAGMYDALHELQQANKDLRFNMGDLTKMVLESQSSFQGYNFNLRQTAQVMGNVAAAAQKQGATYEMSMKAAKGLTDIISGGAAPDWAKYVAGDKLLDQVKGLGKAAATSMDAFKAALPKTMKDLSSDQLTGLRNMAQNYKEYGNLSASYMTEELLRGTEAGNEEMFRLMKQYGSGSEGRELLKRIWGMDDAAATAATLAIQGKKTWADVAGKIENLKAASADRKPPSVTDLRSQTQDYVQAVNQAQDGISGSISKWAQAWLQDPWKSAVLGALGSTTSGVMQLIQTGAMTGLASKAGGAVGGIASGATSMGGAVGGAGAAGNIGQAGAVLAAATGGYAIGTAMVEGSKAVEKWTEGLLPFTEKGIPALDKWLTGFIDLNKIAADKLNSVMGIMTESQEAAAKQFTDSLVIEHGRLGRALGVLDGNIKEGTAGFIQFSKSLEGFSADDLEGIAKGMAKEDKFRLKGLHGKTESEEDASARILEKLKAAQSAKAPTAGTPEYRAFLEASKTQPNLKFSEFQAQPKASDIAGAKPTAESVGVGAGKSASVTSKGTTVVLPQLSPEQSKAVSIQMATNLGPEVKGMASGLFDGMAKQSTEYNAAQLQAGVAYWADMVKSGKAAWNDLTKQFQQSMGGTSMIALTPEGQAGGDKGKGKGKGKGKQGPSMGVGASVGPDGSIHINFSIPRNLLDKSNRQTKNENT